jgi:hypothetical protein
MTKNEFFIELKRLGFGKFKITDASDPNNLDFIRYTTKTGQKLCPIEFVYYKKLKKGMKPILAIDTVANTIRAIRIGNKLGLLRNEAENIAAAADWISMRGSNPITEQMKQSLGL